MEAATAAAQSVSYAKLITRPISSSSTSSSSLCPSFFQCKASLFAHQCPQKLGLNGLKLQCVGNKPCSPRRNIGLVHASNGGIGPAKVAQGWLLEPVGDGDWRHIGFKVALPGAYEIFSSEKLVGRVPEKADLVIPVATVSALHARIESKDGTLFITDLDSTNGTFINEQRVLPGATAPVPPGSLLTFGDTNLATFRVSKIEKTLETEVVAESEGTETAPQPEATSSS